MQSLHPSIHRAVVASGFLLSFHRTLSHVYPPLTSDGAHQNFNLFHSIDKTPIQPRGGPSWRAIRAAQNNTHNNNNNSSSRSTTQHPQIQSTSGDTNAEPITICSSCSEFEVYRWSVVVGAINIRFD
uniref:Putative secreted protein n=1 Tax=Anopheles marajoara TaxID=58244 RepID=A0A2M4C712_9DIPT